MRPPELRLRLAAILAADAVAYSRLMAVDARGTIEALEAARRTFQTVSVANGGRVVDTAGDSVLAIYAELAKKSKEDLAAFRAWSKKTWKAAKAFADLDESAKLKADDPARGTALKAIDAALKDYYASL